MGTQNEEIVVTALEGITVEEMEIIEIVME